MELISIFIVDLELVIYNTSQQRLGDIWWSQDVQCHLTWKSLGVVLAILHLEKVLERVNNCAQEM